MIVIDGIRFRPAPSIVQMPGAGPKGRVGFGRVVKAGTKGAVASTRTYADGSPVWVIQIQIVAMSLSNMGWDAKGRHYLAYDGACFTAKG